MKNFVIVASMVLFMISLSRKSQVNADGCCQPIAPGACVGGSTPTAGCCAEGCNEFCCGCTSPCRGAKTKRDVDDRHHGRPNGKVQRY